MFQVKICGVLTESDVTAVAEAAAKHAPGHTVAIGLNFYPPSIRYVDPLSDQAALLSRLALENGLTTVGVFVNEDADLIRRAFKVLSLDAVQLHGDESVLYAQQAVDDSIPLIRAIKLPPFDSKVPLSVKLIDQKTADWSPIAHLLLDADGGAQHGGSGKTLNWGVVAEWAKAQPRDSWSLAGGLRPDNVSQAIKESTTTSVDTASGAEDPRGIKSPRMIQQFIQTAVADWGN